MLAIRGPLRTAAFWAGKFPRINDFWLGSGLYGGGSVYAGLW